MLHHLALILATPARAILSFPDGLPDGFVRNRTLLLGFAVALILAFFAKVFLRTLEQCQLDAREQQRELAATTGNGPPNFNG